MSSSAAGLETWQARKRISTVSAHRNRPADPKHSRAAAQKVKVSLARAADSPAVGGG
jgi:hypothetical protein